MVVVTFYGVWMTPAKYDIEVEILGAIFLLSE